MSAAIRPAIAATFSHPRRFTLAPDSLCGKTTTKASPRNSYPVVAIFQNCLDLQLSDATLGGRLTRKMRVSTIFWRGDCTLQRSGETIVLHLGARITMRLSRGPSRVRQR